MQIPSNELWERFKRTNGAFSCCEAIALYNICLEAPEGTYIELGTFHGKSAMIASAALKAGCFTLVDPIFSDTKIAADVFFNVRNAAGFDKTFVIGCVGDFSTNIIPKFGELAYVFVDSGSHGEGLPMQEVKMLEDMVVSGGIVAFHDFRSQFVEVEEAYNYLLSTGKYQEIKIDWQPIVDHVLQNNIEEGNDTWHHTETKTPCYLGALLKV